MTAFSYFAPFYSGVPAFLNLPFPNICPVIGRRNCHHLDFDYASFVYQWITIDLKGFIKGFSAKPVVAFTVSSPIGYIDDPLR